MFRKINNEKKSDKSLFEEFRNKQHGMISDNDFSIILGKIGFDSWIILDLDDTVFRAEGELGNSKWFDELCKRAEEILHCNALQANKIATHLDNSVKQFIQMRPVEDKMVGIIKMLQDIGIPVIGLTARNKQLNKLTIKQLKHMGIDFSHSKIWEKNEFDLSIPQQAGRDIYFNSGIIYCDENDKGLCFKAFVDHLKKSLKDALRLFNSELADKRLGTIVKLKYFVEMNLLSRFHLVMADDKLKHLHSVRKEFSRHYFFGLHYTHAESKMTKPFEMRKAVAQLRKIHHRLPESAKKTISTLKLK